MSYYRFAEIAIALCFGLTFALVGWWEIAEPIWREESSGSAEEWLEVASAELSLKVGDGGNRGGGRSWGWFAPPLLLLSDDIPCPRGTSFSCFNLETSTL